MNNDIGPKYFQFPSFYRCLSTAYSLISVVLIPLIPPFLPRGLIITTCLEKNEFDPSNLFYPCSYLGFIIVFPFSLLFLPKCYSLQVSISLLTLITRKTAS